VQKWRQFATKFWEENNKGSAGEKREEIRKIISDELLQEIYLK
jgi:hypothetical protein